jgi:2-amino-4-hydroxy-6-hydroxymethyldihydropteridine diphosphokinase
LSKTPSWIGLGGNLGDPSNTLTKALRHLDESAGVQVMEVSPAWHTPPWGVADQPEFLNAVAHLETDLDAWGLLSLLHDIEYRLGRRRGGQRWGPRIIDLDLLVHGDAVISREDLVVPHPRLAERAFVLVPLHALAPRLEVPGLGRVDELLAALDDREVRAVKAAPPLPFQPG